MGEILFWIVAVFLVLGGPPLLAVWSEWRRGEREVERRPRRRPAEETGREQMQPGTRAPEASRPGGLGAGALLLAWTL